MALLPGRRGIDASSINVVNGHGSPAKVVAFDGMNDEVRWLRMAADLPWPIADP